MATAIELIESRSFNSGGVPRGVRIYRTIDSADEIEAWNAVAQTAPGFWDFLGVGVLLPLNDIFIEPIDNLWQGTVQYGVLPQEGESYFSFDTGGGTQHIIQAPTIAATARAGEVAPNNHDLIGVTKDGVEGVDVPVPVYNSSETHYLPNAVVTNAYKAKLFELTGTVNAFLFHEFGAGTGLFLGAAGARRGSGDWEVNFRFAGSPNVNGITIGDLEPIDKEGWDYLWILYEDTVEDFFHMKKPKAAYVHRPFLRASWVALGITIGNQ